MKNLSIVFNIGLLIFLFSSCDTQTNKISPSAISFDSMITATEQVEDSTRPSITFIMGTDSKLENPYYQQAKNYYEFNPEAQTDFLIDSIFTLVGVRDFLENNNEGINPWGQVNIVVHSNQWTGLSARIEKNGPRVSNESLDYAIQHKIIKSLDNTKMDEQTNLNFYSCGLGKNQEMLDLLSFAFGGEDGVRPLVRSSKHFMFYESNVYQGQAYNCKKYMAQSWHTYFKTGYRPGNLQLANQLKKAFPNVEKDWLSALDTKEAAYPGQAFHHTYRIPVVWTVTYENKSERPNLKTEAEKQEWLKEQEDLLAKIDGMGIPKKYFNWTIRPTVYTNEEGDHPAIKAIGFCTILNVLEAITETDEAGQNIVVSPAINDEEHFGFSRNPEEGSTVFIGQ